MNSKGFAVSPFFLIVLVLLGAALTLHFAKIDKSKSESIIEEGIVNKQVYNVEKPKASFESLLLFASYRAAYDLSSSIQGDLSKLTAEQRQEYFSSVAVDELQKTMEEHIAETLQEELSDVDDYLELGGVKTSGAFTVELDRKSTKGDGFIAKAFGLRLESADTDVASDAVLEKYVDSQIFNLIDEAPKVEGEYVSALSDMLECRLSGMDEGICRVSGNTITCQASLKTGEFPEDYMVDAREVATSVLAAAVDVQRKAIKGDVFGDLKEENIAAKLGVTGIEVSSLSLQTSQYKDSLADRYPLDRDHCCASKNIVVDKQTGETKPVCATPDIDYRGSLRISGTVTVSQSLVGDSTLSEESAGRFEVCAMQPKMVSGGESGMQPEEFGYPFTVEYNVYITFDAECKPLQAGAKSYKIPESSPPAYTLNVPENPSTCKFSARSIAACSNDADRPGCGCGQ